MNDFVFDETTKTFRRKHDKLRHRHTSVTSFDETVRQQLARTGGDQKQIIPQLTKFHDPDFKPMQNRKMEKGYFGYGTVRNDNPVFFQTAAPEIPAAATTFQRRLFRGGTLIKRIKRNIRNYKIIGFPSFTNFKKDSNRKPEKETKLTKPREATIDEGNEDYYNYSVNETPDARKLLGKKFAGKPDLIASLFQKEATSSSQTLPKSKTSFLSYRDKIEATPSEKKSLLYSTYYSAIDDEKYVSKYSDGSESSNYDKET